MDGRTDKRDGRMEGRRKKMFPICLRRGKDDEEGRLTCSVEVAREETNGLLVIVLENEPRITMGEYGGEP